MPDKAEVMPFYTKKNKVTKGIKNAGYNGIKQEWYESISQIKFFDFLSQTSYT